MSIDTKLSALKGAGKLIPYEPTVVTSERHCRQLYFVPDAHSWCFPKENHPDPRVTDAALAWAHQQSNAFILGRYFDDEDMHRLRPEEDEVWEMRTYMESPLIRLFGWFPGPNRFVVAYCKLRDDLELYDGPKWHAAMRRVGTVRDDLMPELLPFIAGDLKYYVTY